MSQLRRQGGLAHGIARALLARPGDTRNGVRAKVRLCPTACPTGLKCPMAKPNQGGIIIRVSGVRVPPPASRQGPGTSVIQRHSHAARCRIPRRSPRAETTVQDGSVTPRARRRHVSRTPLPGVIPREVGAVAIRVPVAVVDPAVGTSSAGRTGVQWSSECPARGTGRRRPRPGGAGWRGRRHPNSGSHWHAAMTTTCRRRRRARREDRGA
jgi:hypothetical protein